MFKHFLLRRFDLLTVSLLAFCVVCPALRAQGAPGSSQPPTRAQQVPLSGRQSQQSGSVTTQQSTSPGGNSTVNTSTTTIQVQGSYIGSARDPYGGFAPATLTLEAAMKLGLRYNLGSVSSSASLRQVRGQRLAALSQLLPTVSAGLSEIGAKTDLAAQGFSPDVFGNSAIGSKIRVPATVGPYHYYDARASVNYNVLDFTAIHNYREAVQAERAADLSGRDARELVVLAVGGTYLKVLADIALVESQEAEVKYAQASYDQAASQNQAGTKSDVDTQKILVQLQTEQQRLTSQRSDLTKQVRMLQRITGMPLDGQPSFEERLPYDSEPRMPIDQALNQAFARRADLQSAQAQLKAAEESLRAAHAERLPTVSVNGYVGVQGINPNHGNGVFSGTASVTVPIFQGGRIHADEQQAQAAIDQRRAEYLDQRGAVEQDVRNAYLDFQVAADQVRVSESNRSLALKTLKQSQDRFAAGVTNSVEVVQAQQTLAGADADYINSLYSHNVAKINIARAVGEAESAMPNLLKGTGQ